MTTQASQEDSVPAAVDTARAVEDPPRSERVRTLDFSQPTKFTAELRRRIERVLDPFCETLAARLSAELRTTVELALSDSSQLTWAAAKAQLPADSIAVGLEAQPIERQMLMSVELALVLRAVECLLGGSAAQAPAERRLSEIDWALTRRLLDATVSQLSLAWRDLGDLSVTLGELDLEGDAGIFAPIGEPTFSLTLDCRIDGLTSTLALLIPWTAIEPVADGVAGSGAHSGGGDPREADAVRRGLAGAQVMLRAEVGSVRMPAERMLALTPGSLLALENRADDGVQLFAEGVALGHGRPGRRGTRRALKLTTAIEPAASADVYAKLGRVELERARERGGGARHETPAGFAALRNIPVRVWAELGRTSIPLGGALELPLGAVVELDQGADDPVELFVNGLCFAHGSLVVSADGEWAVQVENLV